MKPISKSITVAALLFSVSQTALVNSAIVNVAISIRAGQLDAGANIGPIAPGTLIQLVDLGANGFFDQINVGDGTTTGLDRWVSGDDVVYDLAFNSTVGITPGRPGDFPSLKAFDMRHSEQTESTTGRLNRVFELAIPDALQGKAVGIRWFPGLLASNFNGITLASGQVYGQFSRNLNVPSVDGGSAPQSGGLLWTMPSANGTYTFDTLATTEDGGTAPLTLGNANYAVVPEPGSIALSLLGAIGLAAMRRRRA